MGSAQDGGEIFKGEACGYGVHADGELADIGRARLGEEGQDVGTCGGLLGGRYGVFEVIGYGVDGQGAGLLKKFGGG